MRSVWKTDATGYATTPGLETISPAALSMWIDPASREAEISGAASVALARASAATAIMSAALMAAEPRIGGSGPP